jgi:hypothetical protein
MKYAVLSSIAVVYTLGAPSASAGEAVGVTITRFELTKTIPSAVLVVVSTPPSNRPACAVHSWHYSLPLSNTFENQMYAALLAAYASGSLVDITGTNLCTQHAQIESMHAVSPHT